MQGVRFFPRHRSLKGLTPIHASFVDERLAVAQQAVEEEHRQRSSPRTSSTSSLRPKRRIVT